MPRAAWLAIGAIVAALLTAGGPAAGAPWPVLLAISVIGAGVAVAAARRQRWRPAALLLGASSIGIRVALAALTAGATAPSPPLPIETGTWPAVVLDVSAPSGSEQRAILRVSEDASGDAGWTLYAWLPRHPAIVPGDALEVRGAAEPAPTDGSGFADFLAARGAAGTMRVRSMRLVAAGTSAGAAVEALRWSIDDALSRAIPEPEAGLAAGILVGLRERVGREVADDFTTTGLTHVVAISGWNIALVAGIATSLLRAVGLARRPRSIVVITAIVGYTIIAGAEASVVRAALMGGVVLVAREGGRPAGAAAALGIACWCLLLADPAMVGDIGLQLSLAATAGLLAMAERARSVVERLGRGHTPAWLGETLGVSLAAQFATLPLILLHFGRLSLISPLANLLVAPIVPMAMLGAFAGVLLGPVVSLPLAHVVTAPVALAAWLPLAAMVRGSHLLAGMPLASVALPPPADALAGVAATFALLIALRAMSHGRRTGHSGRASPALVPTRPAGDGHVRRSRKGLAAVVVSSLLVATTGAVIVAGPAELLTVSVLDVGQGDAILLTADDGTRLLVDGGPDPDVLVRRLDERIPVWDRRIDMVVLTHPHEDHAGGLAGLMPRYRVGRVAETGMATDGAGTRELRAAAARAHVPRIRLVAGDHFRLGRAAVSVLWPPTESIPDTAPSTGRGVNDTSIVLRVDFGRQRALLTGDIEDDKDNELLTAIRDDGRRWDLLKVAHHGSATATTQPLLDVVRPRLAAVSSGAGNRYGHPAASTLARLAAAGARIWRTDLQGTLSVTFDGVGHRVAAPSPGHRVVPSTEHRVAATRHRVASTCRSQDGAGSPSMSRLHACYARFDASSDTYRSADPVGHLVTVTPIAATLHGRRRSGFVSGLSRLSSELVGGSAPGRYSRAPPRRRQGAAHGSSASQPWSWSRWC